MFISAVNIDNNVSPIMFLKDVLRSFKGFPVKRDIVVIVSGGGGRVEVLLILPKKKGCFP